jgi:hypothetical protein
MITERQKRFLDRRFREAAVHQPDLEALRELLLAIGGTYLVVPPSSDSLLRFVIDAGFVMAGPVVRRTMAKSKCHRNVAKLWTENQCRLVGIGTGYSLSDDGLWRQHSWGLRREELLETTVLRVKYFGILLQHGDADLFAMANLADISARSWQTRSRIPSAQSNYQRTGLFLASTSRQH